jgi:hypothetical protein
LAYSVTSVSASLHLNSSEPLSSVHEAVTERLGFLAYFRFVLSGMLPFFSFESHAAMFCKTHARVPGDTTLDTAFPALPFSAPLVAQRCLQ